MIVLAACSPQLKPSKTLPKGENKQIHAFLKQEEKKPEIEIKKLHYVLYEQGQLKWNVWAQEAQFFGRSHIKLYQLKLCAAPDMNFCISADKGDWLAKDGKFVFEGQVVLNTKTKGRLLTNYLVYFPKDQKLKTKAFVQIIKDGLIIKGRGFSYDIKTGVMKVFEKTRVEINA